MRKILYVMVAVLFGSATLYSQLPTIHNWRAYDKTGVNVFESPKEENM